MTLSYYEGTTLNGFSLTRISTFYSELHFDKNGGKLFFSPKAFLSTRSDVLYFIEFQGYN